MRTAADLARRVSVCFFLGLFLLGAIVAPARAIIPAGIYAGTIIRGIIAGATTRAAIPAAGNAAKALSASGLFGVSAAAYIVMCGSNYVSGNDCSGTPLAKLRTQGNTSTDGETAAGTVAPTGGSTYAATSVPGLYWRHQTYGLLGPHTSAQQSCEASQILIFGSPQGACTCIQGCGSTAERWTWTAGGSWTAWYYKDQAGYTCPSGGTLSGTTCTIAATCPAGYTLTNGVCVPPAGLWAADNVPSYRNQAGVWVADPKDPDTAAPLANPYVVDRTAPDGQPMKVEITANPDGSIRLRTFTQTQASGQTATNVNDITISSGGTPSATTNIFYGDVTTVYNQTAPTVQTPAPNIELPTDYNREATQQQVRTELQKMNTDGLKIKETGTPESVDYNPAKDALKSAEDARKTGITTVTDPAGKTVSFLSLSLPTTCTPIVTPWTFAASSITWDFCQYKPYIDAVTTFAVLSATIWGCVGLIGTTIREA